MTSVFNHPFTSMIAGPTQSGKTTFLKKLIDECQTLIKPAPDLITFCYSQYQKSYDQFSKKIPIEFKQGLPSIEDFDPSKNNLVILDDLMTECENDPSISNLFTVDSHHKNISVILITHNIFSKGKHTRTISLNSHYMILFNNPRDRSQINHLARQMYPKNSKFLVEAYDDAVDNKPHGNLLIDLKQGTDKNLRIRTGIFENEDKIVYCPIKD